MTPRQKALRFVAVAAVAQGKHRSTDDLEQFVCDLMRTQSPVARALSGKSPRALGMFVRDAMTAAIEYEAEQASESVTPTKITIGK